MWRSAIKANKPNLAIRQHTSEVGPTGLFVRPSVRLSITTSPPLASHSLAVQQQQQRIGQSRIRSRCCGSPFLLLTIDDNCLNMRQQFAYNGSSSNGRSNSSSSGWVDILSPILITGPLRKRQSSVR
ncbi:hypothetical protein DINM_004232 [Dirofilaria immitis]|nr:hypothetical protein [Dirofilaria immitis]